MLTQSPMPHEAALQAAVMPRSPRNNIFSLGPSGFRSDECITMLILWYRVQVMLRLIEHQPMTSGWSASSCPQSLLVMLRGWRLLTSRKGALAQPVTIRIHHFSNPLTACTLHKIHSGTICSFKGRHSNSSWPTSTELQKPEVEDVSNSASAMRGNSARMAKATFEKEVNEELWKKEWKDR